MHDRRQLRVEGGEHFGAALQLGDLDASAGEAFRHLESDVPGADDDRGARVAFGEVLVEREGVAHRVHDVHPVVGSEQVEALNAGERGQGAGADDQLVVVDDGFAAARPGR